MTRGVLINSSGNGGANFLFWNSLNRASYNTFVGTSEVQTRAEVIYLARARLVERVVLYEVFEKGVCLDR